MSRTRAWKISTRKEQGCASDHEARPLQVGLQTRWERKEKANEESKRKENEQSEGRDNR